MNRRYAVPAAALLTMAALLLVPELAWAQNEVAQGALRAHRWLVVAIRGVATLIIAAGFLMWSVGQFRWTGGIMIVCGIIGAIFSDRIATEIIL